MCVFAFYLHLSLSLYVCVSVNVHVSLFIIQIYSVIIAMQELAEDYVRQCQRVCMCGSVSVRVQIYIYTCLYENIYALIY